MGLVYVIRCGGRCGTKLKPHRYKCGYRASQTRIGPHVYVRTQEELIPLLRRKWFIRMSAPGCPPSLIAPRSVEGWIPNSR